MSLKTQIITDLKKIVQDYEVEEVMVMVEVPSQAEHGDFSTNVAMILGKKLGNLPAGRQGNPMEIAEAICEALRAKSIEGIEKIEVVKPGFINFWLAKDKLLENLQQSNNAAMKQFSSSLKGKKIMVEFAHPNTHKEMHIGHMRTLITGESISRLLEASGATVFRANYQGDIGPHVAKALYGIQKLMEEKKLVLSTVEGWDNKAKAHFLGEGYVKGNQDYEEHKEEIDAINTALYEGLVILSASEGSHLAKDSSSSTQNDILSLYQRTRQWSLDYYEEFYTRFYTQFDQLFFESEVAEAGKKIVENHIGKVFARENGAIIFPGEKYAVPAGRQGLHTRVFITQAGNPTYEGKEMGNAYAEYKAFPFDLKMHIVASEQAGYFQVVFKALDLIDPGKFEGKQHHLSMGMVTLTDRKMSSRTGDVLTVDWLIDQVKAKVEELAKEGRIASSSQTSPQPADRQADPLLKGEGDKEEADKIIEMITIGAIKYSVLKGGTGANVAFDIEKSVALDGNSGPYLQYTYARTRSVIGKWEMVNGKWQNDHKLLAISHKLEVEEIQLLRRLYQFDEIVQDAAEKYAPNVLCTYLYQLAAEFNLFYQKHKVIGSEGEAFRLTLTQSVGNTLQKGLQLLGIEAPEKM